MNLIGNKVLLRELRESDMELLNQLMNEPSIENNVVGWSKPVTMNEQLSWFQGIKNDSNIRYGISDVKDNKKIYGTAIISNLDFKNRTCSIDIKLDKKYQKMGFGKETISLLIDYAFLELNINRIEADILEYNIGSQKVFEANGFKKEGVLRQAIYKKGKYNDLIIYSLLKEDN